MSYGLILIGLIALFIGGEVLVRGSVAVARKLGLSELVIGLTLVGFGTSMPELVTTLRASTEGATGIAVGNVVGSNIANILLVLGLAALLHPIITNPRALARDTLVMVGITAAFIALVYFDLFTRPAGIMLVVFLLAYVVGSVLLDRRNDAAPAQLHAEEGKAMSAPDSLVLGLLLSLAGVAGVIFGARWLVSGAVEIAHQLGIAETVVGLTIVAVGTSLPELATSAVAAFRGRSDVALGNVIGSNIFNLSGIIGVTAIVSPFSVITQQPAARSILDTRATPQGVTELPIIGTEHIGALVLATALMILFGLTGKRLSRWEGLVLLGGYVLYMGMLFEFIPTPFDPVDAPAAVEEVEEPSPEPPIQLDPVEDLAPTDASDMADELEGAPQ
ncbi:MAG: calcium/sodium antiporter [Hyphomonadaceae bacterium]|nr:calcium/sodium antiporter [Hyphomonadaceae bacterium]